MYGTEQVRYTTVLALWYMYGNFCYGTLGHWVNLKRTKKQEKENSTTLPYSILVRYSYPVPPYTSTGTALCSTQSYAYQELLPLILSVLHCNNPYSYQTTRSSYLLVPQGAKLVPSAGGLALVDSYQYFGLVRFSVKFQQQGVQHVQRSCTHAHVQAVSVFTLDQFFMS